MFRRRLLLSVILIALPASADVLQVAISGEFNNLAISTPLTAPNASWALTFDVDSQPIPTQSDPDIFVTAVSNLEYDLNGHAVSGLSSSGTFGFFVAALNGGFNGSFQDAGNSAFLSLAGGQMFSGATSAPKILTGTFDVAVSVLSFEAFSGSVNASSVAIADLPATPEPGANLLLGTGLAGAALLLRRRRRFAAPPADQEEKGKEQSHE